MRISSLPTAIAAAACLSVSPADAATPDEALPSPLVLRDVLEAVARRNLGARERRQMADAGAARPRAATRFEDPTVSLEWWQQPTNFSSVPIMLSVRQPIPWPGRLRSRGEASERDAAVLHDDADEAARHARADAKRAYFDLVLAERSLAINERQHVLVRDLVATTDARYRAGKAEQAELFKAQSELLAVESERFDLERDREQDVARLNLLLDRPAGAPLGPTGTVPALAALPAEADLVRRAIDERPEMRRARDALLAAESRAAVAHHESDPELNVWGAYMRNFNGIDSFTAGVSSTLPVFSTGKRRSLVGAAQAEVEAAKTALAAAARKTEAEVHTALAGAAAAARHARLHADKLIPLADLTLESARAAYQAGRLDFRAVLDATRMVRDHHLNHVRYLVEHERRVADLEESIGSDLARAGGER